jgi:hypothetical protein
MTIRKYGPACHFSSARAFTFAQRVKKLNIVGLSRENSKTSTVDSYICIIHFKEIEELIFQYYVEKINEWRDFNMNTIIPKERENLTWSKYQLFQCLRYICLLFFCNVQMELWSLPGKPLGILETYFSYPEDALQTIRSLPIPNEKLSQEKFEAWDPLLYELTMTQRPDGQSTCLMAYLYVAQRDFALLSHHLTQEWLGNPDEMIAKVIHLFYSDYQPSQTIQVDPFSSKIGNIVYQEIQERFTQEQANLQEYPIKEGSTYWKEKPPYVGQRIGTCRPWLLTSLNNLQAAPPPDFHSIIWPFGLNQIRFDQARLTPEMRQLIFYWASEEGPESGNWFAIVNRALQKKDLSLLDFLLVRAAFAMSYTDSMIAAFDSKYTYLVMRPHMRDANIVEIVKCPKHPSYPSAHSVTSATASTILSHFFPNEKETWQKQAFEAGNSRIWGGLHFMYDNEEGLIQGEKVGQAIIQRLPLLSTENEILFVSPKSKLN